MTCFGKFEHFAIGNTALQSAGSTDVENLVIFTPNNQGWSLNRRALAKRVIVKIHDIPNLLIVAVASKVIFGFLCFDRTRNFWRVHEKQADLQVKLFLGNRYKGTEGVTRRATTLIGSRFQVFMV